ncbi:hypothetical protein IFR09_04670 [Pseudomonas syringae]|nr:hypothetical protein [Pseudomonas syringae]MBD8574191.1 hypothetical protein [Pseudomonas syringae]MBD8791688.1 hypothetical protein [Pseudomonas syringae]MBD8801048.1 hypothetical protein [Pseudomonas syringae]MBD8810452.1 hypothetical protein [Pseudomonas syringae]
MTGPTAVPVADGLLLCQPADSSLEGGVAISLANNNKRQSAMLNDSKFRQAGIILFATILVLIVPNLSRLFG